jgi:uncharacterized membrane protein YccC
VAVLFGYLISLTLHTGHGYWIFLTIIVILKPAYSLTKTRNRDRLIGTFFGVLIGVTVLFLIKNNIVLLVLMIVFMTGCYIFLRTNYFISVMLMTPYLLLFFHLLYPNDFRALLTDRIIDTAIGSVIAFMASIFFIPKWEHTTIKTYMIKMLEENSNYYSVVAGEFTTVHTIDLNKLRGARKNALVALANLSDAFNRMLYEPKRYQKSSELVHRFVVLNHTLISHVATLSYYLQTVKNVYRTPAFVPVIDETVQYFKNAIAALNHQHPETKISYEKQSLRILNEQTEVLMEKRRQELQQGFLETETKKQLVQTKSVTDQFNYIYSIATDLNKVSAEVNLD